MGGGKFILWAAVFLAGCNMDRIAHTASQASEVRAEVIDAAYRARLQAASCADAEDFTPAQTIEITATPLAPETFEGAKLDGLSFHGGWHLTSDEPNFGGLSGLAVAADDTLLAVSDNGAFVWINMADQGPSGLGAIAYMRDQKSRLLDGKSSADAEGLELAGGLALVSFERDHRVLAFDLERCGASANGTLVARIPEAPFGAGRKIPENNGPEALALYPADELVAGLEAPDGDRAIVGHIGEGTADFSERLIRPAGGKLTGLDGMDGTLFALFRNYSPLLGNRIDIHAHQLGNPTPQRLAALKRPFPVDNFEGIAATQLEDGTVRLYIISDDNFSERQRTLLMAFDLAADAP